MQQAAKQHRDKEKKKKAYCNHNFLYTTQVPELLQKCPSEKLKEISSRSNRGLLASRTCGHVVFSNGKVAAEEQRLAT